MIDIPIATKKALDRIGLEYGIPRKSFLFIFKESDTKYRRRLRAFVRNYIWGIK